ncbi:MAG TPA: sensor histidine kinase KdpD, partial [Dehalococcoidia bacterium]|nr:sensor histidine kinase KdpD [Dehalococcoidia bacterium]
MNQERPDPDAILARIQREEREQQKTGRGHLRIYLGAFPGVGKTFAMLNEAHRRQRYGEDVVVGFAETHGRRSTQAELEGLDVLPRKRIDYRGVVVEELDVDAVLERRPQVCLVDELAHTNVAGSEREKRYEDVEVILDAGIDVVSTLNIQHLESLNDMIADITGVRVRETIPDSVLDEADEVILIDLSPEGARARLQHGNVYPPEQAKQALESFFRPENLAALRELALRRTTQEVDEQLEEYMRESERKTGLTERVLVLVDDNPASRALLRHGWRLAQGLDAELLIAYFRADR